MYLLTLFLFLTLGGLLIWQGVMGQRRGKVMAGGLIILATFAGFGLMGLWGEWLWFESLGYGRRFWVMLGVQVGTVVAGMIVAALVAGLLTRSLRWRLVRRGSLLTAALGGAVWGLQGWREVLLYFHRVGAGVTEPVFGLDAGFYLFSLPFYDDLYLLLLYVVLVALVAIVIATFEQNAQGQLRVREERETSGHPFLPLALGTAALALILAGGRVIAAWQLLYSEWGVVAGAGWTDVHVRVPACLVLAGVLILLGALPLLPAFSRRVGHHLGGFGFIRSPLLITLIAVWLVIGAIWLVGLGLAPALVQSLLVEPNEITYERPYIERNIDFTRRGFHLDKVEERQFPASEQLTRNTIESNRQLLDDVRLWDWRALDAVYKQFQEIRLYYEFNDVDLDRYTFNNQYRQVMVSARELVQSNLPQQSQTFVNRRFKYTHGYGLTLSTVSDFTPEGLPNMLVRDIPPRAGYPELAVSRPQIYYGESTDGPVAVNTEEKEFDHPSGENNVYTRYDGRGGVQLSNLWRKILFGWKFDGTRFLLSGYPTHESRVLFHRQVRKRVARLAPFLEFDEDPYIVLAGGRLYWIIDAYTTSSHYPYSQPFQSRELVEYRNGGNEGFFGRVAGHLEDANYVRNSVKAVVDAYEGTVSFYVFEPQDPLIQAWRRAFPRLFHDRAALPQSLAVHVRYPQDFLLAQGLVYAKYHMRDPAVFYNQEDLWVRATEKHYSRVVPVEPYYVMWELPGSDKPEFVLIQPFTPKNRQVLIGWIAGLSDGANYGRFLAYKFPKEKRILGPQQVETKIDQDAFLSGQLTLWDQRGSNVIRGNVLAIPLDDTLLYVEPIYLQAETAAYPELRLVVVMHGDNMSYAESFDAALAGLFEGEPEGRALTAVSGLGNRANAAFEAYLQALGEQRFDAAAEALARLRDLLKRLAELDAAKDRVEP